MSVGNHSFLYFDCTKSFSESSLAEIQSIVINNLKSPYYVFDLASTDPASKSPLHTSLSKPFTLPSYLLQALKKDLTKKIKNSVGKFTLTAKQPFFLLPTGCGRRVFVCLGIDDSIQSLIKTTHRIDSVFCTYAFKTYFSNPLFHISVASIERLDRTNLSQGDISEIRSQILHLLNNYPLCINTITIEYVSLKSGNMTTQIKI